ncbi:MAG: DUF2723 domain-containing protein [Proteiniphilum sp.]|jgi:hypothetical protein|nr:DUF2723 domain-containing protein [Proteiniphilum sp.]
MIGYKLINNISGWITFAVAAAVYLLTIEPTASFWDCGEFITQAYKLEVGHPPGAPIFMLLGNLFSQLAQDPSQVAKMVNSMSALMSAFTILFLFWTITHLTRKLIATGEDKKLNTAQTVTVIGSGLAGALVYTFSDTFWFSAAEGEVYAFSSMLTALVFWLILKWEDNADKPRSDKWIVLIAYVMGLSIGVHLLNLLCIPAIVLIHYFKKTETPDWKGVLKALLLSFGLIVILMWGIIPGLTKAGGQFELFFVNTLGLPYHTGLFVYLILLAGVIGWALFETSSPKGKERRARIAFLTCLGMTGILFIGSNGWLWAVLIVAGASFTLGYKKLELRFINLAVTCLMVILTGFSAYALIPIRSNANPPLDLNKPGDVFSLGSFLNREQYGQVPLIYGTTYASQLARNADGSIATKGSKSFYKQAVKTSPDEKDRYEKVTVPVYQYTNTMLFPRMHSTSNNPSYRNHSIGFEQWGGVTDLNKKPSFRQNMKYLFSYQINHMYWRYFMWNFSGRQNDVQGHGEMTAGNWITGIPFVDEHLLGLGPQDEIAPDIVNSKAHNRYYMLPLLLGIIGILYQLQLKKRGKQSFAVVFMLFFMTGLAIILYLNQMPFEPRERDYAYAGSFYAFAIWVGMGVAGISYFLRKYIKNSVATASLATGAALCVTIQMASQNWDDHDRSGRTLARDTGMNYLNCVGENAILFTNGDNDTYPLWYVQETEGFRTDVRITNLSFLQTDWYIDQLLRRAYESEPLPVSWSRYQYSHVADNLVYVITRQEIENVLRQNNISPVSFNSYYDTGVFGDTISLSQTLANLKTGQYTPRHPFSLGNSQVIPGNVLSLDIDTARVDWKGLAAAPAEKMYISLEDKQAVHRQELMIMEMLNSINSGNWQRPIYFATTITPSLYMNLQNRYFSLNGLAYQVVPGAPLHNGVNIDAAYDNMVNKFRWGGLENNPDIYLDETCRRMCSTFRQFFTQLVDALIGAGENEKALAALDRVTAMIPSSAVAYGTDGLIFARAYFRLGEREKAEALIADVSGRVNRNLDWYMRLSPVQVSNLLSEVIHNNLNHLMFVSGIYQQYDGKKYAVTVDDLLQRAQAFYQMGVSYAGDTLLKEVTDGAIRGYYSTPGDDTLRRAVEEETMQKTLGMMRQFSPRMLEQYQSAAQ